MKHRAIVVAVFAAILCVAAPAAAQIASGGIPAGSGRVSPLPPAGPEQAWTPPSAPGPSAWCQEHPQDCRARDPKDPPVRTQRDHCMDRMGNGDGYASMWEFEAYEHNCP